MHDEAAQDALAYYRTQCDELGGRVLRLQEELLEVRREAQRNRTLAIVVQQIHAFAQQIKDSDTYAEALGTQLLMLLVERLQIDVAALLRIDKTEPAYRIAQAIGVGPATRLSLAKKPPGSNARLPADHPVCTSAGLTEALWIETPPVQWALLLGSRRKATTIRRGLDPADSVVAESAIKVYDGLLDRQAALRALRNSEARYRVLFESAQDAVVVLDLRGQRILDINRRGLDLFAGSPADLHRRLPHQWTVTPDAVRWRTIWKQTLKGRAQLEECQLRRADGRIVWTEINLKRIDARPGVLLGVVRDISRRKAAEDELHRLQERLQLALEGAEVGLYDVDLNTGQVVYDDRFLRILGAGREQAPKTVDQWWQSIHPDDLPSVQRIANEPLSGARNKVELEYRLRHTSGEWVWVLDRGKGFDHDSAGKPRRAAGTCLDITERKLSEASIHRLAFFDPLTDLPNRRLFLDRLTNTQAAAQRNGHIGAVLFLDLDRFKQVNDARGHVVGDLLLQEVANRLQSLLRGEDTVARFGGDEFIILLPNLSDNQGDASRFALLTAEKIRLSLSEPVDLADGAISAESSIGITLLDGRAVSVHDILREADTALYRAKESGRDCIRFFESSMQRAAEARFNLEAELRHALEQRHLTLYYQPQVDASEHLIGAEALLRWIHPTKGMIAPGTFIPFAEETSLILPIGRWVLTEACGFLKRLDESGQRLRVSVNVSPRQFRETDFVNQVRHALESDGIPPERLALELTEGVIIEDVQGTVLKMHELKRLGVKLSIDDFGTGYSSLTYLKQLPIDELKIDRSFIQDVCTDSSDAALVEAILSVCRHLGVAAIAEGVETAEQLHFLRARNCGAYQGYYFGMPLCAETFLDSLDLST